MGEERLNLIISCKRDVLMKPPPNETPEEREKRLADEAEAQRRSDAIDEEINKQRLAEKRESHIRILLLGKSYSSGVPKLARI